MSKNKKEVQDINRKASGEKAKGRSQGAEVWYRMRKNKGAMVGLVVVVLLILLAVFSDVIFDYSKQIAGINTKARLLPPSWEHPFGTDGKGRDLFVRVLYGTKYSLTIGVVATLISTLIAVPIGALAGYYGGFFENIVMRIMDMLSAVPFILMGIVVVSALGANMMNLIIALGIVGIPKICRMTRAAVLTVKNQEYIESARIIGLKERDIIIKHVLPNCLSPIIVSITLQVATVIISASSLSFLGLGVPAPSPEWGALLSAGRDELRQHANLTLFPGLAIMITVLALNLMGDGLRDAMDPKLRK